MEIIETTKVWFYPSKIEPDQEKAGVLTNIDEFPLFTLTEIETKRIKKEREKKRRFCKILKQTIWKWIE